MRIGAGSDDDARRLPHGSGNELMPKSASVTSLSVVSSSARVRTVRGIHQPEDRSNISNHEDDLHTVPANGVLAKLTEIGVIVDRRVARVKADNGTVSLHHEVPVSAAWLALPRNTKAERAVKCDDRVEVQDMQFYKTLVSGKRAHSFTISSSDT